jgi:hypothetical protein
MVEKILGEQQTKDIFFSAMLTGLLNEKQAAEIAEGLEKNAQAGKKFNWLKLLGGIGNTIIGGAKDIGSALMKAPDAASKIALLGAGTGVLSATAYDILKDNVSSDDPKTELNAKIEAMYNNRKKELEDAKWMAKVRGMRDELKRDYKKMTSEEYESKYNKLLESLDERKELV